jgi:HlyD family secretion protein
MKDSNNKEQFNIQELQKLLAAAAGGQSSSPKQVEPEAPKTIQEKAILFAQKSIEFIRVQMHNSVHYIDRFINFVIKSDDPDRNEIIQYARPPIMFGTIIIVIFVGIGGMWAGFAPLDSASHAMGTVMASSNKQVVQYSGGGAGIVKKIFVKQGDLVKANDPLVELDETQARAQYETILNQYLHELALESRLLAERDDLPKIEFNEILFDYNGPEISKLIQVQTNTFNSRRDVIEKEVIIANKEMEQFKKKIEAYKENRKSLAKNLEITVSRLRDTRQLIQKGYSSKSEAQKLEIQESDLRSKVSSTDAEIANSELEIAKTEDRIVNVKGKFSNEILRELKDTQIRRADLREKFVASKDSLDRIILKSPVDGIVNQINVHTIGGVIGSGQMVVEITPINDTLIIDTKIPAGNIDSVMVGQQAKIKFLAFKSRTSPMFIGTVVSISPDTVQDQQAAGAFAQHNKMMARAGDLFYIAKIELDMAEFERIAKPRNLKLIPGMMADIQIITGTRTLVRYLLDPVTDQAFKAFKER